MASPRAAGVLAIVMAMTGCQGSDAAPGSCTILCSAEGGCPSGMACSVDGYCHEAGDATDCTPEPPPPPPPAAASCGPCDQPPTACASSCEAMAFEPTGDCSAGECVYDPVVAVPCPYGCDTATGLCREESEEACAEEICDAETACGGVCHAGSGCTVELDIDISGDCVTTACPAEAPYPIGCNITMSGSDSRGCVANQPTSPLVFFKEGNKCDVGHVSGRLYCSSAPGSGLSSSNCPVNKPNAYYPMSSSGCPN